MSLVADTILRVADTTVLLILMSDDPNVVDKRTKIFSGVYAAVVLVNFYLIYDLNKSGDADIVTVMKAFMQLIMYSVVLGLVIVNDTSPTNSIDKIRQAFAVWIAMVLMFEPLFAIYSTSGSDIYKSLSV
jgi:hypothetical protein